MFDYKKENKIDYKNWPCIYSSNKKEIRMKNNLVDYKMPMILRKKKFSKYLDHGQMLGQT
ncbi:hypothetical protein BpHYR1_003483 [Brachionus plicatilis]|uniref:Uncharacterized protein n=1 Tax=Brachionus plicatilis TaxID=10195 RepID=A0A3M7T0W6_BRAPC|nr:hypothetical protein BpHYR1_003483 [Brachionus plicatilis]